RGVDAAGAEGAGPEGHRHHLCPRLWPGGASAMSTLRLGLDFGGTKIAVGVVALAGRERQPVPGQPGCEVLSRRQLRTIEAGDGVRLLEQAAALVEEACAEVGLRPGDAGGVGPAP